MTFAQLLGDTAIRMAGAKSNKKQSTWFAMNNRGYKIFGKISESKPAFCKLTWHTCGNKVNMFIIRKQLNSYNKPLHILSTGLLAESVASWKDPRLS